MQRKSPYKAIVIGSSAGGINALAKVLSVLPSDFSLPIVIVQHLHPESGHHLPHILGTKSALKIKQSDEKELIKKGWVYLAPPNYHLLIEEDFTFSLSLESPVNYSRPSIDVLFESAAYAYRQHLIGIVLTGANHDGSLGLKKIKELGGFTMVQDPKTAEADAMPKAAIEITTIDKILPLQEIGLYLLQLVNRKCH